MRDWDEHRLPLQAVLTKGMKHMIVNGLCVRCRKYRADCEGTDDVFMASCTDRIASEAKPLQGMSRWMCRPLYGGGLAWAVYRLKDMAQKDDGHNREYKTGFVLSKMDARQMVEELNGGGAGCSKAM